MNSRDSWNSSSFVSSATDRCCAWIIWAKIAPRMTVSIAITINISTSEKPDALRRLLFIDRLRTDQNAKVRGERERAQVSCRRRGAFHNRSHGDEIRSGNATARRDRVQVPAHVVYHLARVADVGIRPANGVIHVIT